MESTAPVDEYQSIYKRAQGENNTV